METIVFIDTLPNAPIKSECMRQDCRDNIGNARIKDHYMPYPLFDDINKNGIPDSGEYLEPCSPWTTPANRVKYGEVKPIYDTAITPKTKPIIKRDTTYKYKDVQKCDTSYTVTTRQVPKCDTILTPNTAKDGFDITYNCYLVTVPDFDTTIVCYVVTAAEMVVTETVSSVDVEDTVITLTNPDKVQLPCGDGIWADFNNNGKRDSVESFIDDFRNPVPKPPGFVYNTTSDIVYSPYWDLDVNRNGIPDPMTTVLITRTVLTKDGIADNELIYGQSDGGRIEVTVWAEAQGLDTKTPEKFVLPISEGSGKYWNYFD
jgi:hypothetical protein